MLKILLCFSLFSCLLPSAAYIVHAAPTEKLNPVLYDRLEQCTAELSTTPVDKNSAKIQQWLGSLYEKNGLRPLWVTDETPGDKAALLLSVFTKSAEEGLDPEQYHVDRIASLMKGTTPEELADLDTQLTLAFIKYTHDVYNGRIESTQEAPSLTIQPEETPAYDPLALLELAKAAPDLSQFFANLLPTHSYYTNLRAALPNYQKLAAAGGWPQIAAGPSINPDRQDARIPAIRKRLQIEGYLRSPLTDSHTYEESLVRDVTNFQLHHGLTGDGVIGKATVAAMNIPAQQKVRQIIINLERWRWEAHALGEKYVLVDIAGFTLEGIKNGAVVIEMPVVVGTQQHETPVFSDHIQYIEVNPQWHIPTKIASDEILKELIKNPHHLTSNHIRLFSDRTSEATELNPLTINWSHVSRHKMSQFKLRQDPGKWNALGAIKFIFPNSHNVYMHDTPSQAHFKRSSRAFSHGCIRLSNPVQLAEFLLEGDNKNGSAERIRELIASGKRTIIRLPKPLPVHITYQTVKSNTDGTISFHADIYNRDPVLEKILFHEQPQ